MKFLNNKIILNCLTQSLENAQQIVEATEGHALVGILTANYKDTESAVEDIQKYQNTLPENISVGLGSGNPSFGRRVAEVSALVKPAHINQVFTLGGMTRAVVGEKPWINSMMRPSGIPGIVLVNTGALSDGKEPAAVPVHTAILMAKEQGANAVKFFPMHGLKAKDELIALSAAAAKEGFGVEPTGGIDISNFEEIVRCILETGVQQIIPHVYTSIVDKNTNLTRIEDVKTLYAIMKELTK